MPVVLAARVHHHGHGLYSWIVLLIPAGATAELVEILLGDKGCGASSLCHHMKRLRQAGVAWSRPDGTRCYVSLRPELDQCFPGLLAAILAAAGRQRPPAP